MSIIIGIDHGYYAIKTAHCSFPAGLTSYGEHEPYTRPLRRAGGIVNDSCGMHVHVDASKHTPQSLKNVLSIMYSKEDILFAALKVNPARIDSYCQAVDFLAQIERIVPWKEWLVLIQPCYYKGERGNKPYPLETMLRLYLLQNLYDLSDEATAAEAIDSRAFSDFCGVDSSNQVPDGDTIGRFRNLLVKNGLQEKLCLKPEKGNDR